MTMAPDLVVRGGTVLDGTGGPAVGADVRSSRGRIASIGRYPSPEDATEIDATGLFVAPSFIDIHSHSDFTLLVDPRAVSAVSQGVTLEVVGNCGYGCAPIVDPSLAREAIYGFRDDLPLGWRSVAGYLERLEAARDRGADAAFDMHTRFFGTTYLKVMLPPSAKEGGPAALSRRLADPAERARMKTFRSLITALGDWERIVLLDNPALPENSRRSIADIARETGCDPYDAAYDILLAEVEQLHRPMVILHSYSEELLRLTYRHDACMVGSDATTLAPDGKLAGSTFHGAYTWASWFYRRMARETGTFTPEEAVRKLAGLPAERLGLADRGVLRDGARADLAIFDPKTFGETGTTFEPNSVARGMRHVIVNGVVTLRDGRLTGERGGEVLRAAG